MPPTRCRVSFAGFPAPERESRPVLNPLDTLSPLTRAWFTQSFAEPTEAQALAWPAIQAGQDLLVVAPTGSGKTLAAFLWGLDRLATSPVPPPLERLRILYVSPLKALAADVERNLRAPLAGLRQVARREGLPEPEIRAWVRTGDTPAEERRRFHKAPPDILITTPESLYLLLTCSARDLLRHVETVLIDEVHALVPTRRGAHLALSLARLEALLPRPPQRIGLSATVNPVEEAARFLGPQVQILQARAPRPLDLRVVVPVEDLAEVGSPDPGQEPGEDPDRRSIWPHLAECLLAEVRTWRSTLVFVNSRRVAERLCARLNDQAGAEVARAHHGSVSREQRQEIEEALKLGRLPAVVATSSLELGIDMGAVDLVAQVEAPPSVGSGLQRVGRAGHGVGRTSRGLLVPKWRGDLLGCAVAVEGMRAGVPESQRILRNPLDVLAQQVVAMVAVEDWQLEELGALVRRAAPFSDLPQEALEGVLDMLAGRYPSDEFAELRPRLNWDRLEGRLSARPGAARLALTSGGTIPDRGLYGVFLAGEGGSRVGELDEEMVYESRRGDVFALGASTWRIEEITPDRVLVTPAPGLPARMPFWRGDTPGRPAELGRAQGRFLRELDSMPREGARARLEDAGLDERASENLLRYLDEQREATGLLPDDRTLVVERFRDVLGDWRLCLHSPLGGRVHAPWALVLAERIRQETGMDAQVMATDDGIVLHLPEALELSSSDLLFFEPDELSGRVQAALGGSALFASRFRECAARALLLPRRTPGRRNPLWLQRQRSAMLLAVASRYPDFPIVLEAMRECLQDVFDLPALQAMMTDLGAGRLRVHLVETSTPSPFAAALLFNYLGAHLYEGDAPLAERRAGVLALDSALLARLLGQEGLRDLLDQEVLERFELELQRLNPERALRGADDLHDALRDLGDLSIEEVLRRGGGIDWLEELRRSRRAAPVRVAGQERWIALEDAWRFQEALGTPLPPGIPQSFLRPVPDPLGDLVHRFARTHGPFTPEEAAGRWGMGRSVVLEALRRLERSGSVQPGEFRPGGKGQEWCHAEVLRGVRRRTLARLRREVQAVPQVALARFLPRWQSRARGVEGLLRALQQLQGVRLPAAQLESLILPFRVPDYNPAFLDQLCAAGEVFWVGAGALGADDGWIRLYLAEEASLPASPAADPELSELACRVRELLSGGGGLFFRQIFDRVAPDGDQALLGALWELVWAGLVTNDTLAPLRIRMWGPPKRSRGLRARRGPLLPTRQGPPAGAGRWSLVPQAAEPTAARLALAEQLLDRHGILTRSSVEGEGIPGGFSAVYPVLKALEETGRCRRGYFVEGLGGAQFALPGAVERLRAPLEEDEGLVLAAADPANPYGAALPWPEQEAAEPGHRPSRRSGAVVVLVRGVAALFLERGLKSALALTVEPEVLRVAALALAQAALEGRLGRFVLRRVDGQPAVGTPLGDLLKAVGFQETWQGLRWTGQGAGLPQGSLSRRGLESSTNFS